MSENVKLYMEDWLYNSALVGLYNILKEAEADVTIGQDYIEFDSSLLENLEEKYFNYFINKYEDSLAWTKIVAFEDFLLYHKTTSFQEFNINNLEQLNNYITNIIKRYIKSASYVSAYALINIDLDILSLEKKISPIKLKKGEYIEDILPQVGDLSNRLLEVINYVKRDESKKYLAAKNVVYTIIKNGWNGVCFLNPQTREKDMYIDYQNYFIKPTTEYLSMDTSKLKYNCFVCDRSMKDYNYDLSFINSIGFDVSRKSSHVWDFNNDIATCPICRLVYTCIPAGFTYVYDQGIFINANSSMENIINVNNKIKIEILKEHEISKSITYRALVNSMDIQIRDSVKYDLADIQVVRYANEKYIFNILTRNILKIISESKDNLNSLVKASYKEINTYFNIYDLVIDSLLNNENLYLLIHKLLVYKLTMPKSCYYNARQIINVMEINYRFMKGVGYMENVENDIVKRANQQGYFLRKEYKNKKAEGKMSGISYRLLNALKVNSKDMFMDTVLNCYLYVQKAVPAILLEGLKDDVAFKTVGYAFISGLIEGKTNEAQGGIINE